MSKRRRRGSIQRRDGKWWARITYVDDAGVRREKRRKATSKAHAAELVRQLLNDADKTDGRSLFHDGQTFDELASLYLDRHLVPIEYDADGKKSRGMRAKSLHTARLQLRMLRDEFGARRLRSITYHDVAEFRARRFQTPTKKRRCQACKGHGKPAGEAKCVPCGGARSIAGKRTWATVNRELTMLNRMFNVARQLGWVVENPFRHGESLVKLSKENRRDTVLGRDEEARLLAACPDTTEGRRLRAIVVCAADTGMRQGEIFQLRWQDVDLAGRVIRVRAMTTKTLQKREVPMTLRVRDEFAAWLPSRGGNVTVSDDPVFGYTANVKRAYSAARDAAGLTHVRFHDLRHTAATRMVQGGMPIAEVGRILGHTDLSRLIMTFRYVNATDDTLTRAAAILDAANAVAATAAANETTPAVN